jgi:hypothetical protein
MAGHRRAGTEHGAPLTIPHAEHLADVGFSGNGKPGSVTRDTIYY